MSLYLGIDGGGTKTECAVADEQRIVGRFTTGTCKIHRVGREAATRSLHAAVQGALYAARAEASQVAFICIGIAGSTHREVVEWAEETLTEIVPAPVMIVGDNVIAHQAAFSGHPGVLVIAGTGSIAYARNHELVSARVGGWGPVVSDEGSGTWIGRHAVAAALRAYDTGRLSLLLPAIFKVWRVSSTDEIVRMSNTCPPPNFAGLFPEIVAAEEAGDELAHGILVAAGRELGAMANILLSKFWADAESVDVAGSGGVFRNSRLLRSEMEKTIHGQHPKARLLTKDIDPIDGAIQIARRRAAEQAAGAQT